jgi:hypothetical protein
MQDEQEITIEEDTGLQKFLMSYADKNKPSFKCIRTKQTHEENIYIPEKWVR